MEKKDIALLEKTVRKKLRHNYKYITLTVEVLPTSTRWMFYYSMKPYGRLDIVRCAIYELDDGWLPYKSFGTLSIDIYERGIQLIKDDMMKEYERDESRG